MTDLMLMRPAKFELFRDKFGEYRFHLRAANGEIILASEGYENRGDALAAIELVRKLAPDAEVDDQVPST